MLYLHVYVKSGDDCDNDDSDGDDVDNVGDEGDIGLKKCTPPPVLAVLTICYVKEIVTMLMKAMVPRPFANLASFIFS